MPLPEHHLRVWDVLHGKEPRNMHPAIRYQVGRPNRLLLNFAPYFAKTHRLVGGLRGVAHHERPERTNRVVSQTQQFAKKIIGQIKQYLTMPQYAKLQAAFMPEGGWKGDSWTSTAIYLSGVDVAQKDPTLAGARAQRPDLRLAPGRDPARRPGDRQERAHLQGAGRLRRHRGRVPGRRERRADRAGHPDGRERPVLRRCARRSSGTARRRCGRTSRSPRCSRMPVPGSAHVGHAVADEVGRAMALARRWRGGGAARPRPAGS
jgi:hypothetical protein